MGKNAEAVVAAVVSAGHGDTKAVTDFKELVEKMDANARQGEEQPANAPTEAADEAPAPAATVVVANDNASPRAPEGSLARILEDHLPTAVSDGTTDDTRAPLVLPATPATSTPKTPRKPLINWTAVQGTLKSIGFRIKQGLSHVGNWVGHAVLGFIFVAFYGILQFIPGVIYVLGWVSRALQTAWLNGWNQIPVFNNETPSFRTFNARGILKETPVAAAAAAAE